jgi:hypothetical protein
MVNAPLQHQDAPIIEAQKSRLGETELMYMDTIILNVDAASTAARKKSVKNPGQIKQGCLKSFFC